jgi:hypothetical protein
MGLGRVAWAHFFVAGMFKTHLLFLIDYRLMMIDYLVGGIITLLIAGQTVLSRFWAVPDRVL